MLNPVLRSIIVRSPRSRLPCRLSSARNYSNAAEQETGGAAFTDFLQQFRQTYAKKPAGTAKQIYVVDNLKLVPLAAAETSRTLPFLTPERLAKLTTPLPGLKLSRANYPVPWVTKDQIHKWVQPLYERLWRIHMPKTKGPKSLYLSKHIFFRTPEDAEAYIAQAREIMDRFFHHAQIDRVGRQVLFASNTHSAKAPFGDGWVEAHGVTMLDVRLAYHAEKLWLEYFSRGQAERPPLGARDFGGTPHEVTYVPRLYQSTAGQHKKTASAATGEGGPILDILAELNRKDNQPAVDGVDKHVTEREAGAGRGEEAPVVSAAEQQRIGSDEAKFVTHQEDGPTSEEPHKSSLENEGQEAPKQVG